MNKALSNLGNFNKTALFFNGIAFHLKLSLVDLDRKYMTIILFHQPSRSYLMPQCHKTASAEINLPLEIPLFTKRNTILNLIFIMKTKYNSTLSKGGDNFRNCLYFSIVHWIMKRKPNKVRVTPPSPAHPTPFLFGF